MLSESWTSLAFAAVIFGASFLRRRQWRLVVTVAAMTGLLIAMLRLPLHLSIPEGDYRNFVQNRWHFRSYFVEQVNFQYHLSGQIVRGFDAALGSTNSSMVAAFRWLSRLIALVFVGCLVGLAFLDDWSERVVRYLALAVAVPTVALFYGYHEFGFLPAALEATAIPLGLIALDRGRWGLLAISGGMLGLGAALHGFGAVALAFMLLVAVLHVVRNRDIATSKGLLQVGNAAIYGVVGWVGAVPLYPIVLHADLARGHAAEFPLRPLFHPEPYPSYNRIAEPIFSARGLRDIGYEFWIVGVLALVLLAFVRTRLRFAVTLAALPIVVFVAFFWPVQGLGEDTDFLASAFPPLFAVAWLVAPYRRLSLLALGIMVGGDWALHHVLTPAFIDEGGEI